MKKLFCFSFLLTLLNNFPAFARQDDLIKTQRIIADSLIVDNARMRVSAENSANSKSANFEPKAVYVQSKKDRKHGVDTVEVKKIKKDAKKVRKEYDPTHPQANAEGYVNMPDISPITEMANLQQAKIDIERSMKVYEVVTDLRYKKIGMMSGR